MSKGFFGFDDCAILFFIILFLLLFWNPRGVAGIENNLC